MWLLALYAKLNQFFPKQIAPAIDEEAQKEAAHDSGASSTLIGFREVYHDYHEQVIPIKTAGNTILYTFMLRELDLWEFFKM